MPSKEETETIIVINRADMEAGYFRFFTSVLTEYNKLCKRIGGEENLIKVSKEPDAWNCWVPARFLSKATYAVRMPVSEERRAKLRAEGKRNGFRSKTTAPTLSHQD